MTAGVEGQQDQAQQDKQLLSMPPLLHHGTTGVTEAE